MAIDSNTSILHLCKVYLPVKGGVQKVVQSIAKLTDSHQHTILTSGEDGAVKTQTLDNALVIRCRSYLEVASMPIAPTLIFETFRQVKSSSLVCLHYPFPLADLALAFSFKLPPLIVYWHSNIVVQKSLKWLVYPLLYLSLKRSSVIVATSSRMVENSKLLTRFKDKVAIIPYGLEKVEAPKTNAKHTRKYFLLVGRHVSYKGIDIAIKSMEKVDGQLIIAGNGPLLEHHLLLTKELGLDDKIKFEKHASDEDILDLIDNCSSLIVPSVMHNEAFALVQLEAMRLKKPVINTALPSTVPTIARNQKEGLTVEPRDSNALAHAMNALLSKPEWAQELGNNGYQRFLERYTDDVFKQSLDEIINKLIEPSK